MSENPYKALGARLEWVREGKKITRAQMAAALGMTWEGYASYETGRVRLPIMLVPPIATALELSNLELLRLLGIVEDAEGAALVNKWVERRVEQERARLGAPPVFINRLHNTLRRGAHNRHQDGVNPSDDQGADPLIHSYVRRSRSA